MAKQYLIGVDLGTSATKAAIYDLDGNLVAVHSIEVPIYTPAPGIVEQENDDFYQTAARAVSTCINQSGLDPRQIIAIAFDSQMAGIGSVDEAHQPATRFDSWLDMRCAPQIEHLERSAGERITALSGCSPTCNHGSKILWWKEERPEDYGRICRFVTPSAYVAGTLAGLRGEQAFMDYTFLHFSGYADARRGAWSDELIALAGIDGTKLPRIVEPWEPVGTPTAQGAKDFGLSPATVIAAGAGDTAAGALGAGIVAPGMLFDIAGTASVLAGCTDEFIADTENRALLTMRSVIPGLWHPLAYIAGGGLALRWFRDTFFNTRLGEKLPPDEGLYAALEALAEAVPPGSEGLLFSPHLGGRVCPANPAMRGEWSGFSWGHTQGHFYRSILEGVAFEYAWYLKILRGLLPELSLVEARAIGGGAQSRLWNQIKADVLGVPWQRLSQVEFGTWGSAMIAGKAAGIFADLREVAARHAIPLGEPALPNPAAQSSYAPLTLHYIALQQDLAGRSALPGTPAPDSLS